MNFIPFSKMSGSGNDFIVINNLKSKFSKIDVASFVKKVCCRRLSIGADGLIFIEKSKISDFKWQFLNSDGSFADMCGNGARCVAKYAYLKGIANKKMIFETSVGVVRAEVLDNTVRVSMIDPNDIKLFYHVALSGRTLLLSSINTGVPHVVIFVEDINDVNVTKIGRCVSRHFVFQPGCVNVNFVEVLSNYNLKIRTYERGVEDETLACGTGNVAAALICAICYRFASPVSLINRSGERLKVYFNGKGKSINNIFLEGSVRIIYTGILLKEGWDYS